MGIPHGHWKTTTFVAGLRTTGIVAPLVLDGPINGEAFEAYVQQVLPPVLHARRQHARQPQTPVRLPQEQQAAIRGNCTAIEVRGDFLAANGWKIEEKKAIVAHGGYRSCWSAGNRLDNEFLHQINKLRYIRQPKIIDLMNNPG